VERVRAPHSAGTALGDHVGDPGRTLGADMGDQCRSPRTGLLERLPREESVARNAVERDIEVGIVAERGPRVTSHESLVHTGTQ